MPESAPRTRRPSGTHSSPEGGEHSSRSREGSGLKPLRSSLPPNPPPAPTEANRARLNAAEPGRTARPAAARSGETRITPEVRAAWDEAKEILRRELGDDAFNNWVEGITLAGIRQQTIRLCAPTRFIRDRVEDAYGNRLREILLDRLEEAQAVEIVLATKAKESAPSAPVAVPPTFREGPPLVVGRFDPKLKFSEFIPGESNALAFYAAQSVAKAEPNASPFFFHSNVGLGKTHLLHAIGNQFVQNNPKARAQYITAERFLQEFVRALRCQQAIEFRDKLTGLDLLLIDDIQFIAHTKSAQVELSHIITTLLAQGAGVVATADRECTRIKDLNERLRSRLTAGMTAVIDPPERQLKRDILDAKAKAMGKPLAEDVRDLLATKINPGVRELEGALRRLFAYMEFSKQPITVESATKILRDLLSPPRARITIQEIQARVAEYYSISVEELTSPKRSREIVLARQMTMFCCKRFTVSSLPEIGRKFGGKDHTTVLYAIRRIDTLIESDPAVAQDYETIKRQLEA